MEPDGILRIGNSRITLDMVIEAYHLGQTPEQFADGYETVAVADVYATIAYYLAYQEQIDAYLKKRSDEADKVRKIIEADPKHKALTEKFRRLKPNEMVLPSD